MTPKPIYLILMISICFSCLTAVCTATAQTVPANLFNIGDSIGVGEAADGTIGEANYDAVWSTGYNPGDDILSLNERFEAADGEHFYENSAARDAVFNQAASGAAMADFEDQVDALIAAATPTHPEAGMVAVLLGANDVCAESLEGMTDLTDFDTWYRAGLDALVDSEVTRNAYIHVSGIPAIYWLWNAKRGEWWCRNVAWPLVPCENLLDNPSPNDCGADNSELDPDTIHDDDGPNCVRRKQFHAKIRDLYNPLLKNVLQEYIDDGRLPNAYFVDIFDIRFDSEHVNDWDCFHPSFQGHALLAQQQWLRSPLSQPGNGTCVDVDDDSWYVGCDEYVTVNGPDCDDGDAANYPGNAEICDDQDNDCDTLMDDADDDITGQPTWYLDADNDGYSDGTTMIQCTRPTNHKLLTELNSETVDCDDGDEKVWAGCGGKGLFFPIKAKEGKVTIIYLE